MKPHKDDGTDDLVKDIKSGKLPISGTEILGLLQRALRKLAPFLQIVLAIVSLIVALVYGFKLRDRLINSQENIVGALQSRLEPTTHPHQGVPAFVLSGIGTPPADNKDYTEELKSMLSQIDGKIKEVTGNPKSLEVKNVFEMLKLEVSGSGPAWHKLIMNTQSQDVYVMVPAISLRRSEVQSDALDTQNLKTVLAYNPEVLSDLSVAANIAPLMKKLDGMLVQSLPIVQAYFISEAGVILLRESNIEDNISYYKGQFYPATLFMDRSYFRGAVNNNLKYGPFNYRTQPYIDAGGNGVVITYSKTVELSNQRKGILCLDVKLPNAVDVIKKRLVGLGADVDEFYWVTNRGIEGGLPNDFGWVTTQLYGQSQKHQSQFLGAIAVESDYHPRQGEADSSGVIRFTIPIESGLVDNGGRKTKLLWARVDPVRSRAILTQDLIWLSAGIFLLVLVSSNIFHDYTVLRREMSNVLKKMSKVMYEASTPFAWLNEKNEFVRVNESFLKLLGYVNEEDLKSHSPTFRGLVTAETQPKYDEVLSKSAAGSETGKYEIDMITKNEEILHVVVHGERIPYPTFWRRGLPHRFGVFLEWSKKGEARQPKTRAIQGDVAAVDPKHERAQRRAERIASVKERINKNGQN